MLLPAFERQHGSRVRSHLVGSGLALKMLDEGNADAVISHAPSTEAVVLQAHHTWRYRKIMFNDFVVVGPGDDPAQVKSGSDARDAMRRIASSGVRFLSRGDQSGTHEREEALWRGAGVRPTGDRLVVAGAGMGATLRIASEMNAYTLTDRATFVQLVDTLRLAIVWEGDAELLNTYAVIVETAGPQAKSAQLFFEWLGQGDGRKVIEKYQIRGSQAFFLWPEGRPADRPDDLPR